MARIPAFRAHHLLVALLLASTAAAAGDPPTLLERFDRPPLVSASLKKLPAGMALHLLSTQAGCPAIGADRGGKPVTLELKEVPFWEAVDRVAAEAGMVLTGSQFQEGDGTDGGFGVMDPLRVSLPEEGLLAAAPCNGGPVRVALVAVVLERSSKAVARFSREAETQEPARELLRVGLKFAPVAGRERAEAGALRVDAAVDEKGRTYGSVDTGMSSGSGSGIGGERWAAFDASGGTGERLVDLSGALEVLLPAAEESVDLDLATLPATAKIGGATFTVVEAGEASMKVTLSGSLLSVEGGSPPNPQVLTGEGKGASSLFGPKPDGLRILLRDAAGKVVTSESWGGGGGDVMVYDFDLSGRPVKATVSGRTKVEKREVPFRFKDIPLPR